MARVKRAVSSKKHRRQVLERAKGYYGNKSRSYRAAHEQVMHSGQYAFRDRRARKGEFRRLWIQRINAGLPPARHELQPVHRRPPRRRHRGRPQGPRRPRRHRRRRLRRARRRRPSRAWRRRPDRPRLHQPQGPTAAAPPGAPQCASGRRRLRHRRARPGRRGGRRRRRARGACSWRRSSATGDAGRLRASPVLVLAAGVLERVATTVTPQPVLAVARVRRRAARRRWPAAPFVVVAAGLADPGNLGTILRVAEAAGAAGVVLTAGTVDPFSPKVVRASAGALFHLPVVVDAAARRRSPTSACRCWPPPRPVASPYDEAPLDAARRPSCSATRPTACPPASPSTGRSRSRTPVGPRA